MGSDGKFVMNWADAMDEADELHEEQQRQQAQQVLQGDQHQQQRHQQQNNNAYYQQQQQYSGSVQSHPVSLEDDEDKRVLYLSKLPNGFQPQHIQQCFYEFKVVDYLDVNVKGEIGYYVEFYNQQIAKEVCRRANQLIGMPVFTELVPYADFNLYRSRTRGPQQQRGGGYSGRTHYQRDQQHFDGGSRGRGRGRASYYEQNRQPYSEHPPRRYEERVAPPGGVIPPRQVAPQQADRIIQPVEQQAPPSRPTPKPNPFGDAKPVDTTNKLLEVENKKKQELDAIKSQEQQNELTRANVESIAKLNIETPSPIQQVVDPRTGPSPPSSSSIPPPIGRPHSVQSHHKTVVIPINDDEEAGARSQQIGGHNVSFNQQISSQPTAHMRQSSYYDDDEKTSQYSRGSNRSYGSRGGRGYRGRGRGYRGRGRARSGVYNDTHYSHNHNNTGQFRDEDAGSEYSHVSGVSHYSRVSNGEVVTVAGGGRGGRGRSSSQERQQSYQGRGTGRQSYYSDRDKYREREKERDYTSQTGQTGVSRSIQDSRPPIRPPLSNRSTAVAPQRILKNPAQTASQTAGAQTVQKQPSARTPRSQPRAVAKTEETPTEVSNQFSLLGELSDD